MAKEILKVENYSYTYQTQDKPVLNNISFSINEGEFCLILGPSGCGKSTLCLSLNGIIPHMLGGKTSGTITIDGMQVSDSEVKDLAKRVAIVFQDPNHQLCNIEVENEVAFGLENLLFEPDEIRKRVSESLKFVGLEGYELKNVWNLSGGEKQRLAIASALALKPKILILDEPTSNLDPLGTTEIFELIQRIRKETNCTIILIEHNLDGFLDVIDKTLVMDKGTILYDGPIRELLDKKGEFLLDDLGLWLPQHSIVGLKARANNLKVQHIPLTMQEALRVFKDNVIYKEPVVRQHQNNNEPILDIHDLHFNYPDGTQALKGVSLKIKNGDMVAIMGKNGSGKSTLALHLVGIHKPSSGSILVEGLDTQKTKMAKLVEKIAYVFQCPEHQFIENSVYKEVAYGLRGLSEGEKEKIALDMLTSMDLIKEKNNHPTTISIGQMRRLSVASMLITQPNTIILDEPTYGQDRKNAKALMNKMRELNDKGKTIIFITHNMKLVAEYAKHTVVLNDGQVLFEGTPEELFNNKKILKECNLLPPPVFRLSNQITNKTALTEDEFISILTK